MSSPNPKDTPSEEVEGIEVKPHIMKDENCSDDETNEQARVVSTVKRPQGIMGVPTDTDNDDSEELDPRKQQWSESLKARLFGSADKDGNFFSFMFLDKIFGETRPCIHCGARGSAKLPPGDNSLQLYVIEEGLIGKQNIMCEKCEGTELVISGDDPELLPQDPRLIIRGSEIREYCKRITHYEVLHDLMEMLHIAAMDEDVSRKEKHSGVASFMLHNAKKICEEWCRPEHAELRLRKYLRLREETLLTKYKPTFTPDCTEEFKEMYEMMAQSFRQSRSNMLVLLQLLKESLIDNPSRSSFMMWVSMAMMHSESYPQFKQMYDPRSFMRVESTEYQAIHERYLSLDVPVGIKKIPIIFVLFEIPRFYHYVEFLNKKLGKRKPRSFLTDAEREELVLIEEEVAKSGVGRAVRRRGKKTKTMVSPEAHFDFLTQQEELDRERVYQSCRDKKAQSNAEEYSLSNSIYAPAPKKQIKGTPPSIPREIMGSEVGMVEEVGLSKAQIKRRRKKAALAMAQAKEEPSEVMMALKNKASAAAAPPPTRALDFESLDKLMAMKESLLGRESAVKREVKVHQKEGVVKKDAADDTAEKDDLVEKRAVAETEKEGVVTDEATKKSNSLTRVLDLLMNKSGEEEEEEKKKGEGEEGGATKPFSISKPPPKLVAAAKAVSGKELPDAHNPDLVLAERAMLEAALFRAVSESPVGLRLSDAEQVNITQELSNLSYPVVADLLESVNSLAAPIPPATPTSSKTRMVSVLVDPFRVYKGVSEPSSGAVAFIKRKNKIRPPIERPKRKPKLTSAESREELLAAVDKAAKNIQDPLQARLARLMASAMAEGGFSDSDSEEEEEDESLDYNFYSLPSTRLPPKLREMVESVERNEEMVPLIIDKSEYGTVIRAVRKYGVSHETGRHVDTESLLCFPSELKLDQCRFDSVEEQEERANPEPPSRKGGSDYDLFRTPQPKGRNASRRAKRLALKNAKKTLKNPTDHQAIMVTQMDTEILKRQGYKVDTRYPKATVVANKDGAIIHVLDGQQTPAQVKEFLAKRYSIVAQQAGPGYVTMPTKDHPGGLLVDPKYTSNEDIPSVDKFSGNRKKLRSKKKAIHEKQCSSLTRWPVPRPRNPNSIPLGLWATQDGPWPEGLDYGTEYHSDREILCESDDEDLVRALDKDEFGNHSMLMRLELSSVDLPDEKAAETVMNRYMEPADLGPGIDPKVPRYIIPSSGASPSPSKKLPAGTTREDIPLIMQFAAPHKQMRAMDAMRIPYKYEVTQVLTPYLNSDGEPVYTKPKRIALMSKITLLPRSRYRSLNPPEEKVEKEKEPEEEVVVKETESVPKISKSQRKKMKKKMKLSGQDSAFPTPDGPPEDLDPSEVVHSKLDNPPPPEAEDEGDEEELSEVARSKLKVCDNCGQEIVTKVQVCAGCKRVAYCNFRCQKASWKVHKKTCSYALRKDGKESTG